MPLRIATAEQRRRRAVSSPNPPDRSFLGGGRRCSPRPAFEPIQAPRSRLGRAQTPRGAHHGYFRDSTLVDQLNL